MAPRVFVPLREIIYTISGSNVKVMSQLINNAPHTAADFIKKKALGYTTLASIFFSVQWYALAYDEAEKLHHRY